MKDIRRLLNRYLQEVVAWSLSLLLRTVLVHRWDPRFFLCELIENRFFFLSVEGKSHTFEIILTNETASIKDFIVVRAKFLCSVLLHCADEVLALVLLESEQLGLVQGGFELL